MDKKFIIWSTKDGSPRRDDDDNIISDGLIGRVTEDNCYLTIYAEYPKGKSHRKLEVGQHISNVRFRLSGTTGYYDIYRVQ